MISYSNNGHLVQSLAELPLLAGADDIYIDFEVGSGDPKLSIFDDKCKNPFICGICITVDDDPKSYYIPVRHHDATDENLNPTSVMAWLNGIIIHAKRWINSNVKFDAHCWEEEEWGHKIPEHLVLVDIANQAKIIDSDRFGYGLKQLSKDWVGKNIDKYDEAMQVYLPSKGKKMNKCYSRIPVDIIGEYGSQDSLSAREVWKYIVANLHPECEGVFATEIKLTKYIFEAERRGMCIYAKEVYESLIKTIADMADLGKEIIDEINYPGFNPANSKDCYDYFCNMLGLPVLVWTQLDKKGRKTEKSGPSFGKEALLKYFSLPDAPSDIIQKILDYKSMDTYKNLFLVPWLGKQKNGPDGPAWQLLNPDYNQTIRTARMSCRNPNAQQLNSKAKLLVHPRPNYAFMSFDYAQIEFRLMAHYLKDPGIIDAFTTDPDTDYHLWVAEAAGIARKPAKTLNFLIGFGGGKKLCISKLAENKELIDDLLQKVEHIDEPKAKRKEFNRLVNERGTDIYNTYHDTLPTLRSTADDVERVCVLRGYVRNMYGRHRHLPRQFARKAFNSLNQATAADLMKERAVAVVEALKGTDIHLIGLVHDEILLEAPVEQATDTRVIRDLAYILERPTAKLLVPIRTDCGVSRINWKYASGDADVIPLGDTVECCKPEVVRDGVFENFSYLKEKHV